MPRHIISTAISILAVAVLLVLSPGTVSARTVYQEYADVVRTSPPNNAQCSRVFSGNRGDGGIACFTVNGDKFWIRDLRADGLHVEMRAQVNTTGDGFRCYTFRGHSYPWQRCDGFWNEIPENARIAFTASLWDGNTQRYTGPLRLAAAS